MDKSKFFFGLMTSALAASLVAAEATKTTVPLSREQAIAKRNARIAAEGGLLERPAKGKVVRVLVRSKSVAVADIVEETKNISRVLRVYVEVVETEGQSKNKTGCLVTLADLGNAPTLLVAPEDYWSTVNVTRLTEGNPSAEVLKSRVIKELWRAIGFALGAANATQFSCVMRPISGVADLDAEKVAVMSPQPVMAVSKTVSKLGFARGGQATYRTACQEGWAPQPTNGVQKAIWTEVHAIPDQPLKIKKQK